MAQPDILVGTERGLFRVGSTSATMLEGHRVSALVRSERMWAVVNESEIWCADDASGSEGWRRVDALDGLKGHCLLADGAGVYVGTSEAHLYRATEAGLERIEGFDAVPERHLWHTPWGGPPGTWSMTAAAGTVVVNVHVGGLIRSTDGGESWEQTPLDIADDVHQVHFDPLRGYFLVAAFRGFGTSADGEAWSYSNEGLHAHYLRSVSSGDDTVFVGASRGPGGEEAAIYRRPGDGSGPFVRCEIGSDPWLPGNVDAPALAVEGKIAVVGTEAGEVHASRDQGESWSCVAQELPPVITVALV